MASLFSSTTNYSLYTIPAAWFLAFAPHTVSLVLGKSIDKTVPRTYAECLEKDQTLDKATKAFIIRAEGASANGFENIGFFAAAVLAGNFAGLPAETLNFLSGGYLVSRVVYNFVYLTHTTPMGANLRSLTWMSSIGLAMTLLVKSGNVLKDRTLL